MAKRQGLIPQASKVRLLESAYYDLYKSLSASMLSLDPGEFTPADGASLMRKAKDGIEALNFKVARWANSVVPTTYRDAQSIARARLRTIKAERDPKFKDSVHTKAQAKEIDLITSDLLSANDSILKNISVYIYLVKQAVKKISSVQAFDLRDEKVISDLLDDAIKKGGSRGKLEQLIRKHFKRQLYERKWISINGKEYDLIKYARMVARTRLRKIQSEAVKNECLEYDNDLYEVSDHGTECEVCQQIEGNVYSWSGKTPGYEQMPIEFPPHPNCEHSLMPTSIEAIQVRNRRAA